MYESDSDWSVTDGGTPPVSPSRRVIEPPTIHDPIWLPTVDICRPNLFIKQTNLTKGKKRLPFMGLFTSAPIRKYDFIGIYRGDFYEEDSDSETESGIPKSAYSINVSGVTLVPEHVDKQKNPMAMANEPPKGTQANVTIIEWVKCKDAIPGRHGKNKDCLMVAFHACRDISEGEELYYYYGSKYDRRSYGRRPYNVGTGCSLARGKIPVEERPGPFLESIGVTSLPNDSYVLYQ